MQHRGLTVPKRALVATAAALCAVALASAASSLDASLSTPVASDPGGSTAGGTSLLALLLAFLRALLSMFGISSELPASGFGGSSVFRMLLAALGAAYRYRLALVGAAAVLTLAALASRRAGGIGVLAGRRRAGDPSSDDEGDRSARKWPQGDPDEVVERAWVDLVERADATDPVARTPAEVRRSAVEAGLDPDAVETLTESFRAARYSGDSPDETRRAAVRRARRALADDSGGEPG
ncbi:hypothetical protein C475_12702 [Halosimplex carlsbadense 2-9-1]|uniref:Protein-glutamine gamma-glutamyltransferase-like C-terminal domain-containing protein n=1 Tax=Halosimplex carlsbadense 2-9-1 TaxID=797114 RepID=M0CNB4_9EURY|nr:DUF4129 domain-containing protein [Halosimplex carlsbadense]ELZ24108.1 hypothetical protein C475_12702 [Halosimplex carlsbadense 2-9-1]